MQRLELKRSNVRGSASRPFWSPRDLQLERGPAGRANDAYGADLTFDEARLDDRPECDVHYPPLLSLVLRCHHPSTPPVRPLPLPPHAPPDPPHEPTRP